MGGMRAILGFVAAAFTLAAPARAQPSDASSAESRPTIKSVTPASGGLGTVVRVELDGVPDMGAEARRKFATWVLYIDGYPLVGVPADGPLTDGRVLQFRLRRTAESRASWERVFRELAFRRDAMISVGPADGVPLPGPAKANFSLVLIPRGWFYAICGAYLAVAVVLFLVARSSGMLREPGPRPDDGRKRFSLSRTQMAFWFLLILGAYLFIGLVTSDFGSTISESSLVLLGISGATALGATFIDNDKIRRVRMLIDEQTQLVRRVVGLNAQAAANPGAKGEIDAANERIAKIDVELAALPVGEPVRSKGFLRDLISDEDGVSLHRFQIVVWSLTLGAVFVRAAVHELAMPEFSTTLLALMGISSGTYLGFKFPEKK